MKKKHRRRVRCRFAFPEHLITQVLSQQRWPSGSEGSREENSAVASELVELLMNYTNGDDTSDDGSEGDAPGSPGDCIVS